MNGRNHSFVKCLLRLSKDYQSQYRQVLFSANIYLFKIKDRNTRKRWGFFVNFENVSHLFLAFLVLPLNKQMLARLLPLWNYSFLKFLISFTNNDLYSLPHMTSRILVNNGMSKSLWFVISMDGQRVSRRFLNQHVLDCSGSILLCNCTLSVKRFSLSKSTS